MSDEEFTRNAAIVLAGIVANPNHVGGKEVQAAVRKTDELYGEIERVESIHQSTSLKNGKGIYE